MASPFTIVVITTAMPGQAEALRAAQEKLTAAVVQEPGCLRYELHQSLEDGRILIFVESWVSEAAWQAHMEGAAIAQFHSSGASLLIQGSALYRMKPIAGAAFT